MSDTTAGTEVAHLETGEQVLLRGFSNNVLEFLSPKAFPPGAPVHLSWSAEKLQGRSIGSKRNSSDDRFVVRIRMVSLTRAQRDALSEKAARW